MITAFYIFCSAVLLLYYYRIVNDGYEYLLENGTLIAAISMAFLLVAFFMSTVLMIHIGSLLGAFQ